MIKILFVSLGCDKNLVDTEKMLGLTGDKGYCFTGDEEEADVIVINTCCFIGDAKEESINTILEMARYKETGRCRALIVTGCLAQRYKEEVLKEIPEVDAVLGTTAYGQLPAIIARSLEGKEAHIACFRDIDLFPEAGSRRRSEGGCYGFLKIAEGCDKRCTYCIIPSLRGRYRSVPMEELLREAEELAGQGVKELILVAQETTLYGVDLYGEKKLPELLHELAKIRGICWIRIQYCYPEEITDELIRAIREEEKVCHYLDMPIQHASDPVLKRMGRRTSRAEIERIVEKLRREIPDIAIRTTLLSGFPGETQEDHEALLELVDQMEFDRLGVFPYSLEEDTPAAQMPGQIPEQIKEERRDELMCLQQEIAFEKQRAMVGRVLEVLIEGRLVDEEAYVGRTYMDSPNVDGLIFVHTDQELISGDFIRVKVTKALDYDLIGEVYDESAE